MLQQQRGCYPPDWLLLWFDASLNYCLAVCRFWESFCLMAINYILKINGGSWQDGSQSQDTDTGLTSSDGFYRLPCQFGLRLPNCFDFPLFFGWFLMLTDIRKQRNRLKLFFPAFYLITQVCCSLLLCFAMTTKAIPKIVCCFHHIFGCRATGEYCNANKWNKWWVLKLWQNNSLFLLF